MVSLEYDFYNRADVLTISRELLGKVIVTKFDGVLTSGRIVEVEAYGGITDKASHAYGGRRTARTEVIYHAAGNAYVYLCYGIHHLFNIVTNAKDIPHAILIRAVEPVTGVPHMLQRTGKKLADYTLTRGPGNVSKALGIGLRHTGSSLLKKDFFIASDGFTPQPADIVITPRIGVDYAQEDALRPYRFIIRNNKYVSGRKS